MTNEKMERQLAAALEKTAPDDMSGVLSRCETRNGNQYADYENSKKKMDDSGCRLLGGGSSCRRRRTLSAGECSCLCGVAGCEPQH